MHVRMNDLPRVSPLKEIGRKPPLYIGVQFEEAGKRYGMEV